MWFFPGAAGAVSAGFSIMLLRDWLTRRKPHLLAWSVALAMFSIASFAAAGGMLFGWTPSWFKTYYLFGAILNVPVLALGTIYLLAPRFVAHVALVVVAVGMVVATIAVVSASVSTSALGTSGIPSAREAVASDVRTLSRYYSFIGFFIVVAGAAVSAWRLSRERIDRLRRLALANLLIALGTLVVAVGSGFARYGRGVPFAVGLLAGVTLMFVGFLKTKPGREVS